MNISQPNWLFHVGGGGGGGRESNILRQHFNQKDHRSCPSVLLFHASVLRWQNNSLSWDNAFHFCRIFPSRMKDRLCSWGEARACQLLMLQGRSPKMMIFHGESNICIPIELMCFCLWCTTCLWLGTLFCGCIKRSSPIKIYLYLKKRLQRASPLVVVCPGIYESLNSNEKEWGDFLTYFWSLISEALINYDGCTWNKELKSRLCWRLSLGLLGMLMSVFKPDAWAFPSICLLAGLASCKPSWEWE